MPAPVLVLVGPAATGKSTVGALVAERLEATAGRVVRLLRPGA